MADNYTEQKVRGIICDACCLPLFKFLSVYGEVIRIYKIYVFQIIAT